VLSQNLVPNPSFECGTDMCGEDDAPNYFNQYVCDWLCPTGGTTDVFSVLLPKTCYSAVHSIESPYLGSQIPRSGNRYAGIYVYSLDRYSYSYREYLEVELKEPLIPGQNYCAEMYVSAAETFDYSCNNLAMYFSDKIISNYEKLDTLPYNPHIRAVNVINDTVNWVRVSGTFKATSAAKYLIIGNFSSDSQTNSVLKVNYVDSRYTSSYYFIDDVSVEHLPQKDFIYTGNTEICKDDATTIKIQGFDDVIWTTLEDTVTVLSTHDSLTVRPQVTTQYRVVVKNCNLIVKDTIKVVVDTFLKVKLGPDTTICAGSSITLNAGVLLGSVYNWQDGSSDQYLTVNKAGNYSVSVSNPYNNCVGHDDIIIKINTIPKVNLGPDTVICKDFYPLKAGEGNNVYQWSNGSSDSVFTPTASGHYWVAVRNECGQASDSIKVFSANDIFIPNVITLNNDQRNDEFQLAVMDKISQKINTGLPPLEGKLTIFNRWGNEIFSSNNYTGGWPPENENITSGVYYFTFNYLNCSTYKGWLHVIK